MTKTDRCLTRAEILNGLDEDVRQLVEAEYLRLIGDQGKTQADIAQGMETFVKNTNEWRATMITRMTGH